MICSTSGGRQIRMRWLGLLAVAVCGCSETQQPEAECVPPEETLLVFPEELPEEYQELGHVRAEAEFESFRGLLKSGYRGHASWTWGGVKASREDVLAATSWGVWGRRRDGISFAFGGGTRRMALVFTTDRVVFYHGTEYADCSPLTPLPVPGSPYRVEGIECEDHGGTVFEFDLDFAPLPDEAVDFEMLLALDALRSPALGTRGFEAPREGEEGVLESVRRTYTERVGEQLDLHLDYEAEWLVQPACPADSYLREVRILNVERCNYAGHTHGRYDASCQELGSIDGRPDWAGP